MKLSLLVLALSLTAAAQVPRPYVALGPSLMPNGYAPFAYRLQGGVYGDSSHVLYDLYAAYDNGHKTNDGTADNVKGHDRYLFSEVGWKPRGNAFVAAGARWSELETTNYTKGENPIQALKQGDFRVQAGGGADWFVDGASARFQALYVFPPFHESVSYPTGVCSGCGNGLQGPEFTIIAPSPAAKGHVFFRGSWGIFEYHDTVTEPSNVTLTNQQRGNRHATMQVVFMIGFRW